MQSPLQVTFHDVDRSPSLEQRVKERVERLERVAGLLTSCRVAIESPHRHGHQGSLYVVRIHLHLPGEEIVINREGRRDHAHEDVYVAVRDAFDAAERRLQDFVRRRDHRTAPHDVPLHGKVVRHFPMDGYGFAETSDGLEVYFHENSVVGARFADLHLGDEVRIELARAESDEGPQATTIRPIGKHHLVG